MRKGTVVVTGAGRGLGREIAIGLARLGYPLLLASKTEIHLHDTVQLCRGHCPTEGIVLDVCIEEQVVELGQALKERGSIHAIVNNAGVGEWESIDSMSMACWRMQIETNVQGPFLVIRETVRQLRMQGRGLYVNVGSDCSLVGMERRAAYNASKFGLVGLTASLRAELEDSGVQASLIYLGKVDSYFRGRVPGNRPEALPVAVAAEPIVFLVDAYPRVVIEEMAISPRGGGLKGTRTLL